VGFFSQSGALGIAILQRTAERGLGLSTFVSAGNRADVSGNDLMQYWEEDPATTAVLLYLESIGNPRKFTRLARRLSRTKPIVAVKSGRTTQGVPLGHAARALTLPDHAVSALFAQAGVIRVEDLSELFDVAQLLAYQPLPEGNRIAIIDNSDSLGLLAEDAATALGLEPRPPVDLGPGAGATVDAVVALFTPPVIGGVDPGVAAAIVGMAGANRKPVVATYLGAMGMPPELRHPAAEDTGTPGYGSVPSYPAPEDAVRALAYVTRYAAWRRRPHGRLPEPGGIDRAGARALVADLLRDADGPVTVGPGQAAELLDLYGVTVADTGEGISTRIVTMEDPSFGAVVAFGLSDVASALLDDRAYRLAPLTDVEAAELIRATRTAPLLFGHRGAEPVDAGALERLLLRVSRLADDLPEVARLELDPVIAHSTGVAVRKVSLRLARPVGPRPELGPRRLPDL
jgi:acyl-CoA synthetase (NDP forming)